MNVLLTGANGQLGQAIVHALETNAQTVKNDWTITTKNELDVTNAEAVESFVLDKKINIIVNCAAYTNVDKAEVERDLCKAVNEDGARNLANAAAKNGALLIHFSTDYVYNGMTFFPYDEKRQCLPRNYYGVTKLNAEQAIIDSHCPYLIFRLQGLYSTYKNNFFSTIIRKAKEEEPYKTIDVVSDQITGIINADTVAQHLMEIIEGNPLLPSTLKNRGIYNLSDMGCGSWYDFAVYALNYCGLPNVARPIRSANYKNLKVCNGDPCADRPLYSVLSKDDYVTDFYTLDHWSKALNNYLDTLK